MKTRLRYCACGYFKGVYTYALGPYDKAPEPPPTTGFIFDDEETFVFDGGETFLFNN